MSMPPPSTLQEPARTLKVAGRYEVIVAGGGIAGVAAAVAAARAGASVCLLEKAGALGGLATLGNVVPHLHGHVIARFDWDSHFPRPVWGGAQRPSPEARVAAVKTQLPALEQALAARLQQQFG